MDNLQILQIAYVGAIVYIVQTLCQNILLTLLTGRQFKTNKNQIGIQTNDYFICDFKKKQAKSCSIQYFALCGAVCSVVSYIPNSTYINFREK